MTDPHAHLVAAGYLRRGLPVERIAARCRLTVAEVTHIAARLKYEDRRREESADAV